MKFNGCIIDKTLSLSLSQAVLKEYIHAQMSFHAKALEIYTASFQHVQNMNEDEVVEVKIDVDIYRHQV